MKRTIAAVVASLALVVPALAEEKAGAPADDMMGWKPRMPKDEKKDRQEIQALLQKMEAAGKKGDLAAAAALIDFPVLMITDGSKGQAGGEAWSREQWEKVMAPFYAKPMDVKVTRKWTAFFVTDSLATVNDETTMTMHGKKVTTRNSSHLVRVGGAWKIKSMMEGGWGDAMATHEAGGASDAGPGGGK